MNYGQSDSSGTEDDYPPSNQTRGQRGMNGNGRSVGAAPLQNDIESQIRRLEQEAYCSVLRAFKAQSDAITWEKEGVITDLRKELRVSDEEHRKFVTKVNAEDIIKTIREWRQAGGVYSGVVNNTYSNHDGATSPSSSRKRPRTSQATPSVSLGVPGPKLLPQAVAAPIQPSSSAVKQSTIVGAKNKKPKSRPLAANGRDQVASRDSANPSVTRPWQQTGKESLIGQKVMTRWPADNNFYEAVITSYNAKEGLHSLVYDMNTKNEAWEWVNLKDIAPEDICWVGDEPNVLDQVGQNGPKKSQQASDVVEEVGRGKGTSKNSSKKNNILSQNGHQKIFEDIEILHTDTLLNEVENILAASHHNPLEIEKAKKMLREHEQSLIDAIARLADISDGESEGDDGQFLHRQTTDRDWAARNHQRSLNQQVANHDFEAQEISDDDQTV